MFGKLYEFIGWDKNIISIVFKIILCVIIDKNEGCNNLILF